MNRDLIRPLIRSVKRVGRLFNETNGDFYNAYVQNTFPELEAIAFIFSDKPPAPGDEITDRLDEELYRVKAVRRKPWRYGCKTPRYEATLVPLL